MPSRSWGRTSIIKCCLLGNHYRSQSKSSIELCLSVDYFRSSWVISSSLSLSLIGTYIIFITFKSHFYPSPYLCLLLFLVLHNMLSAAEEGEAEGSYLWASPWNNMRNILGLLFFHCWRVEDNHVIYLGECRQEWNNKRIFLGNWVAKEMACHRRVQDGSDIMLS